MPDDKPTRYPTTLPDGLALTLMPEAHNRLYYYQGQFENAEKMKAIRVSNYAYDDGIGAVIREKQRAIDASGKFTEGRKGLMLLIKPAKGASYKNIIDLLDEILINDVKKYAIVAPAKEETAWLEQHRDHQGSNSRE